MDRAEAIRVIKELLVDRDNDSRYPCVSSSRHYEALDLAIEALQEPTEEVDYCNNCPYISWDKDCISRADTIKAMCAKCGLEHSCGDCYEDSCPDVMVVMDMPTCNQKQVTSKLETAETATSESEESTMNQPKSKLDCISRQQAIEAVKTVFREMTPFGKKNTLIDILNHLPPATLQNISKPNNLPPVTPTERTGEWISHELWDMPWFTCSECNFHGRSDFKFCPNCGAKMED